MWYQGVKMSLQSIENECVIELIVIAAESQKTITSVIVFFCCVSFVNQCF